MINKKNATILTTVFAIAILSMAIIAYAMPAEVSLQANTNVLLVHVYYSDGVTPYDGAVIEVHHGGNSAIDFIGYTNSSGIYKNTTVPNGRYDVFVRGLMGSTWVWNNTTNLNMNFDQELFLTLPIPSPSQPWLTASFTMDKTSGNYPLTVNFTNTSTGSPAASSWDWNFGDGPANVTTQNATHTYMSAGTYTVMLTVTNAASKVSTAMATITVNTSPVADFSGTPTSGYAPLDVQFTDASSGYPDTYSWTFGDGDTSDLQSPSHQYLNTGVYTVSLTVTNENGTDTETKTSYVNVTAVPVLPVAGFSGTPLSGYAPLDVQFTDASSGYPDTYSWTFGDGGTSTVQSPSYQYNNPGLYTVSLTVTNENGTDTETKTSYVNVTAVPVLPVAGFSGSPLSGYAPLEVTFTSACSGYPDNYSWSFGDGGSSTAPNPVYTYLNPGVYTVSLTVANENGTDTETKTSYVNVTAVPVLPVADFSGIPLIGNAPLDVQFTDASSGYPDTYSWAFGDGGTSDLPSPSHQYLNTGVYTVSLTVTNENGTDTETKEAYVNVTAVPVLPVAGFSGSPLSGYAPLEVTFTSACSGYPDNYSWSFGDGGSSTTPNPVYTYLNPGVYTVSLTVANENGTDTETKQAYITVTQPWLTASFDTNTSGGFYPLDVQFTDTSTGSPVPSSWDWDFGDGSPTVSTQSPSHTYTVAGTYTVTLTVWNSLEDQDTATTTITVTAPPKTWVDASFTPDVTEGDYPLDVVFTDTSTGSPLPSSWYWDFGDGETQNGQAASHTYAAAGDYTVTLTVWNSVQDQDTATTTITVTTPTPSPTPSPKRLPHQSIQVGPHSELSYLFENGVLSWVVSGPLYNSTRIAYNLFYGLGIQI